MESVEDLRMTHRQNRLGSWASLGLSLALMAPAGVAFSADAKRISGDHSGNSFNPSISPDGKKLSYEVNYFDRRTIELYIHDLSKSSESQVRPVKGASSDLVGSFGVSGGGDEVTYELTWSPAKLRRYIFASSGADKNFDLYDSRWGLLKSTSHPAADGQPVWSDDGASLVYTSARTGEGDLYKVDLTQTSAPVQLTRFANGPEWYPTFAPNSNKLAFVRHTSTKGDHIYVMPDINNPKETIQVTSWASIQTKPSWSPDGTRLAFYANQGAKERYDLYVVDAKAGATPVKLLEGVVPNERRGPAWSPDGKSIVQVLDRAEDFNPILMVSSTTPGQNKILATGTQNNGDVQLRQVPDGPVYLTFVAQGRNADATKDFKRVFLYEFSPGDFSLP